MIIKGISKTDKNLRHFTFDDEDYVVRGGIYYYKVNYGKSKIEGEYGDDEDGYVRCSDVIPLGGKKPRPIPEKSSPAVQENKTEVQDQPDEKAKRQKPAKTARQTKTSSDPQSSSLSSVFEYKVDEIKASKIKDLEKQLNERGSEGWELSGFDTNKSLFGEIHIITIFKRKRG